jgi:hypothetical protein
VIGAIRRWRDETGWTRALVVARIALGLLLLDATLNAALELDAGYFGDVFHWPILPEWMVLPKGAYIAMLALQAGCGALVVIGRQARAALFVGALAITYGLLCDRLHFHNNRWAIACYALLLALSPCERTRQGPLWAARLAQLQVATVYLASGGSKLLDPDWRSGRVILTRFALFGGRAVDAGVPSALVGWFSRPEVGGALAAMAIGTELLLVVALWPRRTRAFALWWGTGFHLTIEATSRVEGFTWLTLAMYALFATPDVRARAVRFDASVARQRSLARAIGALDWLARFEIAPRGPGMPGRGLAVVDRDGRELAGLRALAAVARCVPVLFPLWVPLAAIARVATRDGDARA